MNCNVKLVIFLLIFVFLSYYVFSKLNLNSIQSKNDLTRLQSLNTEPKLCDPIIKDAQQFYVDIDGETYPKLVPSFFNASINFTCLNSNPSMKKILLWNKFGPWRDYKYGLGKKTPFKKRQCPVYNCEITDDKSQLKNSDLVLVYMRSKFSTLPETWPAKTRTVFLLTESPINSLNFDKYEGYFNLTATYNFNSDFSPYYYSNIAFKWEENEDFDENKNYLEEKTKFAVILVSNCRAHSKRIDYVREMQKYAPVDIIGGCGVSCNVTNENRYLDKTCRERITKEYKFFLAFENSLCNDYVTEKFFDTLLYDIVPVVLGLGPYEKWIPKSAYINALDFESPQKLTEYLIYLSENETAYNSYFEWKRYIKPTNNEYKTLCDMCIKLQLETHFGIQPSVFRDIDEFWGQKKNCLQPEFKDGIFNYVPLKKNHRCNVC